MKLALSLAVTLLPTAALADFECTIAQQCGMGQCAPFEGGPVLVHEAGDIWEITVGTDTWQAYASTTVEGLGEINIVAPPQNGSSALVSIFDSGAAIFTFHALDSGNPVAISGFGTCTGEGG